jgi:hypothetical protein
MVALRSARAWQFVSVGGWALANSVASMVFKICFDSHGRDARATLDRASNCVIFGGNECQMSDVQAGGGLVRRCERPILLASLQAG